MKTNYKSIEWTNKMTMPDGIDNPEWDNIAEQVEHCNDLANKLQEALYDLARAMFLNDCTLTDQEGNCEGISDEDVETFAGWAEEIMNETDLMIE